mgnify:CR=1 FL=1|jgi:hypothetical protein
MAENNISENHDPDQEFIETDKKYADIAVMMKTPSGSTTQRERRSLYQLSTI